MAGCCEIIGVFCGLLLILFTTRKWLWTGLFNITAGFIAYLAWMIPPEGKSILCFDIGLMVCIKL